MRSWRTVLQSSKAPSPVPPTQLPVSLPPAQLQAQLPASLPPSPVSLPPAQLQAQSLSLQPNSKPSLSPSSPTPSPVSLPPAQLQAQSLSLQPNSQSLSLQPNSQSLSLQPNSKPSLSPSSPTPSPVSPSSPTPSCSPFGTIPKVRLSASSMTTPSPNSLPPAHTAGQHCMWLWRQHPTPGVRMHNHEGYAAGSSKHSFICTVADWFQQALVHEHYGRPISSDTAFVSRQTPHKKKREEKSSSSILLMNGSGTSLKCEATWTLGRRKDTRQPKCWCVQVTKRWR